MRNHVQVAVIGGGVVGASVLYHLTKAGWKDVLLIERAELTSGSTWHAAGGMHTVNGDPNVAKLQQYTIELYKEIEADLRRVVRRAHHGRPDARRHAGARRLAAHGRGPRPLPRHGPAADLAGRSQEALPAARRKAFPRRDLRPDRRPRRPVRRDPRLRQVRPAGRRRGRAPEPRASTPSSAPTAPGTSSPRRARSTPSTSSTRAACGRAKSAASSASNCRSSRWSTSTSSPKTCPSSRASQELLHVIDFEAEIYMRQERQGMLLGTYERAGVPWSPKTTPWDFGQDLLPNDLERIAPSVTVAFEHFPRLETAGIKKVVNGPFTFAPDGNPLVGPIKGLKNYWVACGVMAGFSQGGGVGLSLANWMVEWRPGRRHLGDGRRALRRLGQPALHEREGARELLAALPHPLPERGTRGRAPAAHHADLRKAAGRERRVRRLLHARAPAVVRAEGHAGDGGRDVPPLERAPRTSRTNAARCASRAA